MQIKTGNSLLIASTGGHLEQLTRLVRSNTVATDTRHWITFAHPQSDSLLADEEKTLVKYIPSRGLFRALSETPKMLKVARRLRPDTIVSTGAAIAVPGAFVALLTRTPMIYIESVSRFDGPSLTGKILSWLPWVERFTQHPEWSGKKWKVGPSVLGEFEPVPTEMKSPQRVFISLGTIKPYRFDRAVKALRKAIPPEIEVRIQYGETSQDYGAWDAQETISTEQFKENISWADIIVLHAGVGSALNILDQGKRPVLLVRRAQFGEHVDDHQEQIARSLTSLGLAVSPKIETLTWSDLQETLEMEIRSNPGR